MNEAIFIIQNTGRNIKSVKNGVTAKKTKIILKFLILLSLLKFNTIKITKNIGNLYALLKKRLVNKNQ